MCNNNTQKEDKNLINFERNAVLINAVIKTALMKISKWREKVKNYLQSCNMPILTMFSIYKFDASQTLNDNFKYQVHVSS